MRFSLGFIFLRYMLYRTAISNATRRHGICLFPQDNCHGINKLVRKTRWPGDWKNFSTRGLFTEYSSGAQGREIVMYVPRGVQGQADANLANLKLPKRPGRNPS